MNPLIILNNPKKNQNLNKSGSVGGYGWGTPRPIQQSL